MNPLIVGCPWPRVALSGGYSPLKIAGAAPFRRQFRHGGRVSAGAGRQRGPHRVRQRQIFHHQLRRQRLRLRQVPGGQEREPQSPAGALAGVWREGRGRRLPGYSRGQGGPGFIHANRAGPHSSFNEDCTRPLPPMRIKNVSIGAMENASKLIGIQDIAYQGGFCGCGTLFWTARRPIMWGWPVGLPTVSD